MSQNIMTKIVAENGKPFGEYLFIIKLLRDMYKQRPSLSRGTIIYGVRKVLQYMSNSYRQMFVECWTKNLATLMYILNG